MTLSDEDRDRLADIVKLQPTKNGELQERWGLDSGSEVHQYLEGTLKEHYFRDEQSLIRATPEAATLVDAAPGIEPGEDGAGPAVIRVESPAYELCETLPDHDEPHISVVAALQAIRSETDLETDVDAVRDALASLRKKDAVEMEREVVPTFRMAVPRAELTVERQY
jgi:hypothetical protein